MKQNSKIKNILSAFREGGFPLVWKKIWRKINVNYLSRFARQMPINYLSNFAHYMPNGLPAVEVELKTMSATKEDVMIAGRLLSALYKSLNDEAPYRKSVVGIWDRIEREHHGDFVAILRSNDPHQVAEYLSNIHQHGLAFGISDGEERMISSAWARRQKGALVKDILVSLAEAIGVLPYEVFPFDGAALNIYRDANALVDKIEKKFGISIAPPDIDGGLVKLKLKRGSFDERDIWSLYMAWRISCLTPPATPISEIGAGIGKVAVYANRFGFRDYTIFDLPLMNVVQGWYLIKSLPGKRIALYGEPTGPENSIKILPYWKFAEERRVFGLVLNADSFPEIDREVVEGYLQKIKKCAQGFLSINHERHWARLVEGTAKRYPVVPEVIETIGGFERIYRFPSWLHKSYVEEFYKIIRSGESGD